MQRPELLANFDHLTLDGLRKHVRTVADYVESFQSDGPEGRRYRDHLASARAVLRDRFHQAI